MSTRILHKRSAVYGKTPFPEDLEYGEIGVNYSAGTETLSIKNSSNEVVNFPSERCSFSGTNYVDSATTLREAIVLLDAKIRELHG